MRNLTVKIVMMSALLALVGVSAPAANAAADGDRTAPRGPVVTYVTGSKPIGFTVHKSNGAIVDKPAQSNALEMCQIDRNGNYHPRSHRHVIRCQTRVLAEYSALAVLRDALNAARRVTPTTIVREVPVLPAGIRYQGDPNLVVNPPGEVPFLANQGPCSGWRPMRFPAWAFPVLVCD